MQTLDPNNYVALQTLDMGNVLSQDGRAHVFDGTTPVQITAVSNPITSAVESAVKSSISSLMPHNAGSRFAISIVAILLIAIVVARMVF